MGKKRETNKDVCPQKCVVSSSAIIPTTAHVMKILFFVVVLRRMQYARATLCNVHDTGTSRLLQGSMRRISYMRTVNYQAELHLQ